MVCSTFKHRSWTPFCESISMMTLSFAILSPRSRRRSHMLIELSTLIGIRQLDCTVDPREVVTWGDKALHERKTYSTMRFLCGV